MSRPGPGAPSVPGRWADIIEEAAATAEAYREEGLEVVLCRPGDVVPLPDDHAFDVLLPGSEFEAVAGLAAAFEPEEVAVFTAQEGAFGYAVVVATDPTTETAVCCPIYVELAAIADLREAAEAAGEVALHLRPLDQRATVVIVIDDPALLFDEFD